MLYFNLSYVEYMRTFRFVFSHSSSRRQPLFMRQNSTLHRILDISTLYPVNIVGYFLLYFNTWYMSSLVRKYFSI